MRRVSRSIVVVGVVVGVLFGCALGYFLPVFLAGNWRPVVTPTLGAKKIITYKYPAVIVTGTDGNLYACDEIAKQCRTISTDEASPASDQCGSLGMPVPPPPGVPSDFAEMGFCGIDVALQYDIAIVNGHLWIWNYYSDPWVGLMRLVLCGITAPVGLALGLSVAWLKSRHGNV